MTTTQRKAEPSDDGLTDEQVHQYLLSHPDFFERHSRLLTILRVPHGAGGGAVSLVERQVAALRQKNLKLERKLRELVQVARANDALVGKIHRLALALIGADDLAQTLEVVESHLRTSFDADQSVLVLFRDRETFAGAAGGRFLKTTARDAPEMSTFETFLSMARPRCGQVRDSQRDYLFGRETDEVGSVALLPLGPAAELGFVAIGSTDADHFHPAMSIDFLARIGDLVAAALARH